MTDFFKISIEAVLKTNEPLIFNFELRLKVHCYFIPLIFKLFDEITKALLQVLHLLREKLVQLLPRLLKQIKVVLSEPASIHDHLGQVGDILLDCVPHLLDWHHVMAIMLVVHAGGTHCLRALLAEVFNALAWMPVAGDYLHDTLARLVGHAKN